MKILRAAHLGMCFGVRDAIALAAREAGRQKVTILGELAHNPEVNESLRRQGIEIESVLDHVSTRTVIVTAHGASQKSITETRRRGHRVVEATCPLVHNAHRAIQDLARAGYHPVIIGRRDHVEVRGLTGDLESFDVVLAPEDISAMEDHRRLGIIAQTTQPSERVQFLVNLIRRRFHDAEVRFVDTVCQPTKLRQASAVDLARCCDVVIVVGGSNSNNTRELAETCRRQCRRVFQIERSAELNPEWLVGAQTVGLTAGTSTPDSMIEEVELWLHSFSEMERCK